jgi:two-component system osmolarity sensor histidine kinase EnvZ
MARSSSSKFIRSFLPRSLFGRSLVILVTPIFLIQLITGFVFFDRHWGKMTSRLAYAVSGEITVIAKAIDVEDRPENLQNIIDYTQQHLSLLVDYRVGTELPQQGDVKPHYFWEGVVAEKLRKELEQQIQYPFVLIFNFDEKWIEVKVLLKRGVLSVTLPERRIFSSSGYIFLLWVLGSSILLLVVAVAFMRNQIRPIRRLAVAAERFGRGRDVPNFKVSGALEVRQAAESFIDMHRRISRQVEQRTALLAGVSHDLRTPLTRLKLQLAMLPDGPDKDNMKRDISDMEQMINGYLEFVRGEGGEQPESISLATLLDKLIDDAVKEGVNVHRDFSEDRRIFVKPMAFERALVNIFGNAIKYASTIWVSFYTEDERVFIVIEDDGPGIPEDRYEDVFRPFVRLEGSRNPETGGIGLGLSIAMDIVHAHGGKIWLEKSSHGGLRVIVRTPM